MERRQGAASPRRPPCCRGRPTPTVRVVRADWFTTKGQGFLYVEARTTEGAQTTRSSGCSSRTTTGAGTAFGSARTMSRFVDSGAYMFHRNLFKLDQAAGPDPGVTRAPVASPPATSPTGSRTSPPLTDEPGLQVGLRRRLQAPAAALRALRGDRPAVPGHRRDRLAAEQDERLPAQGAGHDRRHRAGRGRRQLGGVGPRGRQRHHRRVRGPARRRPPARASRSPARRSASCSPRTPPARWRAPPRRSPTALETRSQGLIDRAHPYRTNAGTGIVAADGGAGRADRLPRPEARRRAGGRGARAARPRSPCCGSASTATAASPVC